MVFDDERRLAFQLDEKGRIESWSSKVVFCLSNDVNVCAVHYVEGVGPPVDMAEMVGRCTLIPSF